jgi:hypothetical protein
MSWIPVNIHGELNDAPQSTRVSATPSGYDVQIFCVFDPDSILEVWEPSPMACDVPATRPAEAFSKKSHLAVTIHPSAGLYCVEARQFGPKFEEPCEPRVDLGIPIGKN